MKKYRCYIVALVLLLLFVIPCSGWVQDSVKEELKLILDGIQDLVERRNVNESTPLIIAIGGCPGVGKSTISQILQTELSHLGIVSVILSLDHYGLGQNERKQFASELDPRRIQWNKLHNTLKDICKGNTEIIKPTINQLTKEMSQETLQLANVSCILFEGAYTLGDFAPMNFLQYADLSIYLESSLENIYNWKWQRELKKPIPRHSEAFFCHMMEILKDFAFHVYPTRKNADHIIHIDFFHRYSITNNDAIKNTPLPNFTTLRLETLSYHTQTKEGSSK
ncbi:MAG: AAA family ATPase [Chlamydiales bacterium]|nr:AAA family ATPase [Chlamydiales bacterium]